MRVCVCVCERVKRVPAEPERGTDNQARVEVGLCAGAKENRNSLID